MDAEPTTRIDFTRPELLATLASAAVFQTVADKLEPLAGYNSRQPSQ